MNVSHQFIFRYSACSKERTRRLRRNCCVPSVLCFQNYRTNQSDQQISWHSSKACCTMHNDIGRYYCFYSSSSKTRSVSAEAPFSLNSSLRSEKPDNLETERKNSSERLQQVIWKLQEEIHEWCWCSQASLRDQRANEIPLKFKTGDSAPVARKNITKDEAMSLQWKESRRTANVWTTIHIKCKTCILSCWWVLMWVTWNSNWTQYYTKKPLCLLSFLSHVYDCICFSWTW